MIWVKFGIEQELIYFEIPYFIYGKTNFEGHDIYPSFDGMNKIPDKFCRGWNL